MPTEELDPMAIQRDAALVQALSTRSAVGAGHEDVDVSDPVVGHLLAWVDWLDSDIDHVALGGSPFVLTSPGVGTDPTRPTPRGGAAVVTLDDAAARRRKRAALLTGATIAALVVSSGAAAAVTGDPLALARAPLSVIEKVNPFAGSGAENAKETLPDPAPTTAEANKLLADAQRALANGHPEKAEQLLDQAMALLGDGATRGQQNRMDHLQDVISAAGGQPGQVRPGQQSPQGGPGHGQGQGQGQGQTDKAGPPGSPKGSAAGSPAGSGSSETSAGSASGGGSGSPGEPSDPKGQGSGKSSGQPDATGTDSSDVNGADAGGQGGGQQGQADR